MDNFLLLAVAGILIVVAILAAVLVFMTMKEKSQKSNASGAKKVDDELETARAKKINV